ncbi:hypothetical protein EI982_07805 [Haloplanus rallus]|uniref:Uncharacterized protein n=1 Tax=Haloplanus rallus TaxID=1816183 RepID=A0A6B9F2V6_9EURY|nr:hypothetical protein [Haloplanus rallus]QGX94706.1 hypothetical protein EI982_07805 [Haloplanus rallus]
MYRRALLSTGPALATAGCSGFGFGFGTDCSRGASLRLRPVTDAEIAERASEPLDTFSPPERTAVRAARRDESPTITAEGTPFSGSGVEYVVVDGAYVAVETPVVATTERTGYRFTLDTDGATADGAERRIAAFDDLPAVDRAALYAGLGFPRTQEIERFDRARAVGLGGVLTYPDDEAEARSELVPDPAYDVLRIGGRAFRFGLEGRESVTVETRRIEVRELADGPEGFASVVLDRYGTDLDGLSPEQREIVETAIDDEYEECAPYSEAYAGVQRALGRPPTRVTGDGDGVATTPDVDTPERVDYANYEARWYAVDLGEYVV